MVFRLAAGSWKIGGGTVWGWISYDSKMDLIYYGTGNPRLFRSALGMKIDETAGISFAADHLR